MVNRDELVAYVNELLQIARFRDYTPNGLQVEGRDEIRVLASAVTASYRAVEEAVAAGADTLLVHHGYFWQGEAAPLVGMKRRRLALLLENQLNLLAYHLPLDAHELYGNNVQLARVLGLPVGGCFGPEPGLTWFGELGQAMEGAEFAAHITRSLGREPLHIPAKDARPVRRIGWCTGAAQKFIVAAAEAGLDAYLTGEASEQNFHVAQEMNIHFFAAGHHATERYGVRALCDHLANRWQLQHQVIDIANPI
ncbi:MAG: Nif3-like dinuclear metal center hexameric protein [Gammaproteobacteria bacterium]